MELEKFRRNQNLSYADLAELIGFERSRAKDAERYCKGTLPRSDKIMAKIVKATNGQVQPNDFFDLPDQDSTA